MYICISIYVYMYICIYVYIYIYIYVCVYAYIYVYVMCISIICICICVCSYIRICMYMCIYTHIHIYIYIYTYPPAPLGPPGCEASLQSAVLQSWQSCSPAVLRVSESCWWSPEYCCWQSGFLTVGPRNEDVTLPGPRVLPPWVQPSQPARSQRP